MKYYSQRYGVDFYQFPMVDSLSKQMKSGAYQLFKNKKISTVRFSDIELYLKRCFNIEWVIWGYKRTDSLHRRGIIKLTDHGISHKYHKIYPLAEWKDREVHRYLKMKKLPLPPDYSAGFRDVSNFKGEALLWLYHNYPDDYELVKKQYPLIEAALIRAQEGTTWGKKKKTE